MVATRNLQQKQRMGVNHLESFATRLKEFRPLSSPLDWVIISTALLTGSKAKLAGLTSSCATASERKKTRCEESSLNFLRMWEGRGTAGSSFSRDYGAERKHTLKIRIQ